MKGLLSKDIQYIVMLMICGTGVLIGTVLHRFVPGADKALIDFQLFFIQNSMYFTLGIVVLCICIYMGSYWITAAWLEKKQF